MPLLIIGIVLVLLGTIGLKFLNGSWIFVAFGFFTAGICFMIAYKYFK